MPISQESVLACCYRRDNSEGVRLVAHQVVERAEAAERGMEYLGRSVLVLEECGRWVSMDLYQDSRYSASQQLMINGLCLEGVGVCISFIPANTVTGTCLGDVMVCHLAVGACCIGTSAVCWYVEGEPEEDCLTICRRFRRQFSRDVRSPLQSGRWMSTSYPPPNQPSSSDQQDCGDCLRGLLRICFPV